MNQAIGSTEKTQPTNQKNSNHKTQPKKEKKKKI